MKILKNMVRGSNSKGQNIIEYLLLTVTVVILLITFMNTTNGPMKNAVNTIYDDTVSSLNGLNQELVFSSPGN